MSMPRRDQSRASRRVQTPDSFRFVLKLERNPLPNRYHDSVAHIVQTTLRIRKKNHRTESTNHAMHSGEKLTCWKG
jgi:hypothetical protein